MTNQVNESDLIAQALVSGQTTCPAGVNPVNFAVALAQYKAGQQQAPAPVAAAPQEFVAPTAPASMLEAVPAAVPGTNLATTVNQAVSTMAAPSNGVSYSLADMVSARDSFDVEEYLKVSKDALSIGDDALIVDELFVKLVVEDDIVPKWSIRAGNNPPEYWSTYDGKVCPDGSSWQAKVVEMQRKDPNASPYRSADLSMELLKPALGKGNKVVGRVGMKIGYSTPITGWRPLSKVFARVEKEGLTELNLKLIRKVKANQANIQYGILEYVFMTEEEMASLA